MGFYIESDVVYITKGDDAVLEISEISVQDESEYELQEQDVLTLTVRTLPTVESQKLIQINSLPGSNRIIIRHEDTEMLGVGRYSADVQLRTSEGYRYTIWPYLKGNLRYDTKNFNNFVIMPSVITE